MEKAEELLKLFENKNCDYDKCRGLIKDIGGGTEIIEDSFGLKTTPLHEAINYRHYDFALELISEPGANLNVNPNGWGPVIWELQYFDTETEKEQWAESETKLRLMRALIHAGANPNPKGDEDGEEFIQWIRYKVGEGDGNAPEQHHLWQMEHIIEAHAYGETERFFKKLKKQAVHRIMLDDWGLSLIDDNLCDCDHAIFIFEDGERMALSSYQVDDDEWNFYAVSLRDDWILDFSKYHSILPDSDFIKFISLYSDQDFPTSHSLDLSIDDAVLRIHADEPNITVGIVGPNFDDYEQRNRKSLFLDK